MKTITHTHCGISVCSFQRTLRSVMPRLCANSVPTGCNSSVSLHMSGLPCRATAYQLAEPKHHRISNAVENTVAGTLAADEACVEEDLKVFRYVGLIPFQLADNLVNGHCTVLKCLQDAEAARFPENLESAGDQLDHLLVDHRPPSEPTKDLFTI